MTPGARIAAAIEVVEEIEARKRPAADALTDWGLSHRFAGSKDRAAIASLVFDAETSALATRAPVDLRVNTLKTTREKVLASLAYLRATPTPYSPSGLRLPLAPDGRGPALAAEPAYIKGLAEIQDEGSQLAAILALAKPGEQVLDVCQGAGGKNMARSPAWV